MAKAATLKDVLYALEYTGAQLCRRSASGRVSWSLEPSGVKVPEAVANDARLNPSVVGVDTSAYGEARFVWGR